VEFQFGTKMAPADPASKAYVEQSLTDGRPVLETLLDLNKRVYTEFLFRSGVTILSTPVSQVMARREGVCQDFSHAMISGLRDRGIPARYTSGCIRTKPPLGQTNRLGGLLARSRARLGGRRSDQRHRGQGRARPARLGPCLKLGAAARRKTPAAPGWPQATQVNAAHR
jgi:transglutaminase-like putative cysteine protease